MQNRGGNVSFCKNKFNLISSKWEDGLGWSTVSLKANYYKKLSALVPLSHKDEKLKSAKSSEFSSFVLVHSLFRNCTLYCWPVRKSYFWGKKVIVCTFLQPMKILHCLKKKNLSLSSASLKPGFWRHPLPPNLLLPPLENWLPCCPLLPLPHALSSASLLIL